MLVHLGPDSMGGGLSWSQLGAGSITGSEEGREIRGTWKEGRVETLALLLCWIEEVCDSMQHAWSDQGRNILF